MPLLRKRIKKRFRKAFKKKITSRQIDKIWSDYVDAKAEELLSGGKIELSDGFEFEIVGKKIIEDKRLFALMSNGLMLKGGRVMKSTGLNKSRPGFSYKIEMKNKNFKDGDLYFEAHPGIKKKVRETLINTNKYFRICQSTN